MLWTLPAPVRALLVSHLQLNTRSYSSAVQRADALSILFCGSDEFSIKSLQALHHAQHTVPGLIERIHVAHRPPKPTGRGLKTLREVPISNAARDLSLQTHVFDTFTGWAPPVSYNLVIAVSFGLLVPPRILRLAKYGGLNVHPSLLPDLRGSAPIEHAILKGRTHTGVSIQTLHPSKFDEGVVLAQTPAPGLPIGDRETAVELEGRLAEIGAGMLVDVLKETRFVEPLQSAGWYAESKGPTDYAPKITKQDRFVDFSAHTLHHIIAIQRALGDVWCLLPSGERLLVHKVVDADASSASTTTQPGLLVGQRKGELLFRAACGRVGGIWASTYAGGAARKGNSKVLKMLRAQSQL